MLRYARVPVTVRRAPDPIGVTRTVLSRSQTCCPPGPAVQPCADIVPVPSAWMVSDASWTFHWPTSAGSSVAGRDDVLALRVGTTVAGAVAFAVVVVAFAVADEVAEVADAVVVAEVVAEVVADDVMADVSGVLCAAGFAEALEEQADSPPTAPTPTTPRARAAARRAHPLPVTPRRTPSRPTIPAPLPTMTNPCSPTCGRPPVQEGRPLLDPVDNRSLAGGAKLPVVGSRFDHGTIYRIDDT
ncbi:hypothetical protein GCM10009814_04830 [Lapillicoccus jejuensis]